MASNVVEYVLKFKDMGLGAVTSAVRKAQDGVTSLQSSTIGLSGVASALGISLGITGLAGAAISAGSAFEQSNIALTTFTGSAKIARGLITDLQQFANVTPFNTSEVIQSGRALAAYGVEVKNILPSLRMIGDVAAGTGQPITEMVTLFGQMRSQQYIYAQDLMQLSTRGIPIYAELGKVLGKTPPQIKKLASEGKVQFPQLVAAFRNMTYEGGRFYNLMDAQSRSTAGRWSNLVGMAELLGIKIFTALQPTLNAFIDLGGVLLENVTPALQTLWNIVSPFSEILGPLTVGIVSFSAAWGIYSGAVTIATIATRAFTTAWASNPLGLVLVAITAIVAALMAWQAQTGKLSAIWDGFISGTKAAFRSLMDIVQPFFTAFAQFMAGDYTGALKSLGKGAFNLSPAGMAIQLYKAGSAFGAEFTKAYDKSLATRATQKAKGGISGGGRSKEAGMALDGTLTDMSTNISSQAPKVLNIYFQNGSIQQKNTFTGAGRKEQETAADGMLKMLEEGIASAGLQAQIIGAGL